MALSSLRFDMFFFQPLVFLRASLERAPTPTPTSSDSLHNSHLFQVLPLEQYIAVATTQNHSFLH